MKAVVVGGGAWGTAFSHLLRSRGHDVTLALRDTIDEAPYEDAELVVLAVPSQSFRDALGHVQVPLDWLFSRAAASPPARWPGRLYGWTAASAVVLAILSVGAVIGLRAPDENLHAMRVVSEVLDIESDQL